MVINLIFYFSGSGNSYFVAKKISVILNENLISINNSIKIQKYLKNKKKYEYILNDNEYIGFVLPVYCLGVPKIINNFINNLKLNNYKSQYIFSILTYNTSYGNSLFQIDELLKKNNYKLNSVFSIQMPGNCILLYNPKPIEEQKKLLENAIISINSIKDSIINKKQISYNKNIIGSFSHNILKKLFEKIYNTKKYIVLDKCIHCSLCVSICPSNIISLDITSKKPIWKNNDCTYCLSCINNCPTKSIEYGIITKNKNRYNLNHLIKNIK